MDCPICLKKIAKCLTEKGKEFEACHDCNFITPPSKIDISEWMENIYYKCFPDEEYDEEKA
jgi:hypothetical protein